MSTRSILAILTGLLTLSALAGSAAAQSSVGIYSDTGGTSCSLTAPSSGIIEAYVVVRPGQNGVSGVQFAAPLPSCFTAIHLADVAAPGTISIGTSQTGISIATQGCTVVPRHVLTIQYLSTGTTAACCPYPIVNDPAVSDVLVADCSFQEEPANGLVSTVNPDGSCPCSGNSPPDPPQNPDPMVGATNVSVFATLSWTAFDVDDNLAEFDVYLGTETDPPLVATVTETSYTPALPLEPLATHYWRVVARDAEGLERSGDQWVFTTRDVNSPPLPPYAPYPQNQAEGISRVVVLNWQCDDIDQDALTFDVHFGITTTPPLVAADVGQYSYALPTLDFDTVYYWQIVARDAVGHETTGPLWSFRTLLDNYPPDPPSQPSPPNHATGVSTDVTLSWVASDVDSDTLSFDLYFGAAMQPPLFETGLPSPSYHLPELTPGVHYYWKVVARDQSLATAGPVWDFSTAGINLPPNVPSSPSPSNLATNVSPPVNLQWFCSDPNGDALHYDVYFGTSSTPPLYASNLPTRLVSAGILAPSQQYWWRIVARDTFGAETSGPTWTFTTRSNLPPGIPYNPSPPDTSINQPGNTTLAWQCSDPDGNLLTYDVYFGTASPPPLVATNRAQSNYGPGLLDFNVVYHWKIVARDGFGAETPGPEWSFRTGVNSPPNAPSNPIPVSGATASTAPTLLWQATDPDGQALTYDVYFGTASDPPLAMSGLSSPIYSPGTLQAGLTYYWRVVASDGEFSTSGPTWWFHTQSSGGWSSSRIALYSDVAGNECSLADKTIGLLDVYVFVLPVEGVTGLQFAAPQPPCFSSIYLGDESAAGTLAIGNSQTGVAMGLEQCVTSRTLVYTIHYLGLGTTSACCAYPVLPDPTAGSMMVTDCNFVELNCTGENLTINEDVYCPCGPLLPVLISSFQAQALEAGVQVRWELAGDETAQRFSLLRWTGDAANPQVIREGAVTGVTGSYLDDSVEPATTYSYELLVRTGDGNEFRSQLATVTTRAIALSLGQNHPNPFNPTTVIPYTLPNGSTPARVRLVILDVSGGVVRTLVDESQTGGRHEAVWDGKDARGGSVSSGVYFYVLDTGGQRQTRKMVLLK